MVLVVEFMSIMYFNFKKTHTHISQVIKKISLNSRENIRQKPSRIIIIFLI